MPKKSSKSNKSSKSCAPARTKLAPFSRNLRSCGSTSFLYITTFARFSAHIGASLYGERTFAEIKAKAVR